MHVQCWTIYWQMHRSGFSHCPSKLIWVRLSYICEAFWVNAQRAAGSLYSSAHPPQGLVCPYLGWNDRPWPTATAVPSPSIYSWVQGRVSGLFPNLPEWVWLNACLRKPAVPWALHGVIIRAVSHDSRLSWNVYPKAWQSLCCMTRDAFQRRCYSSNTNRMSFHPFSHA